MTMTDFQLDVLSTQLKTAREWHDAGKLGDQAYIEIIDNIIEGMI